MPTKKEKQPLSVTHPELAKEANGWDPATLTFGSGKKMSWKCPKGHVYQTSVDKQKPLQALSPMQLTVDVCRVLGKC